MKAQRFETRDALDAALAARLRAVIEDGGSLMLSGGSTPKPAYARLAGQPLHAAKDLHLLFSDERHVPPDSAASNYRTSLPLIEALRLSPEKILRVRTELALADATAEYERHLSGLLAAQSTISLGVLGLGADGHTASLFSFADLERARGHLAIAVQRPDGMQAVSVTPSLIARIEQLLIVVPGHDKQRALAALLARDEQLVAWRAVESCPNVEVWCEGTDV